MKKTISLIYFDHMTDGHVWIIPYTGYLSLVIRGVNIKLVVIHPNYCL